MMQCARRRMEEEEEGKKCHARVRRGMGARFWLVFFLPQCVCRWSGGELECARAADGVALLSGVRLALLVLYHALCTVPMLRITSQLRERERFGQCMGEGKG